MSKILSRSFLAVLLIAAIAAVVTHSSVAASEKSAAQLPKPAVDEPLASAPGQQTLVLAGGCFWGVQAVFQHVNGVITATSGYSGGSAATAEYPTVSTGMTNHAESVKVIYDPSKITYGQLLQVYFSVATDPTQLNRQGPDEGSQYRSVIFYTNDEQKKVAQDYIAQLDAAKAYPHKIVTQVVAFKAFYPAEGYHQNYATLHPDNPYIAHYDLPKLTNLQQMYPQLYRNAIPSGSTSAMK